MKDQIYIGTFRPTLEEATNKAKKILEDTGCRGIMFGNCTYDLSGISEAWKAGHFDEPVFKPVSEILDLVAEKILKNIKEEKEYQEYMRRELEDGREHGFKP